MLKIIITCFMSLVIFCSPVISSNEVYSNSAARSVYSPSGYDPATAINYDEIDVGWKWSWGIGRHTIVKMKSYEDIGFDAIQTITKFYDATGLSNFTFEENLTTIETNTVSTTSVFSSEISTGLQVKAGIPDAQISGSQTIKQIYTIEQTNTYTSSVSKTSKVSYSVKQDKVDGKKFALCVAARIYRFAWETWEYDDFWWGDIEVSESRKTHIGYITVDPYITVVFYDGGIIQ